MTTQRLSRVDPSRLRSLALAAVLVGLVAGLFGAVFASAAGEPAVDDAIAIEEANAAAAQAEAGAPDAGVVGDDAAHDDSHGEEASVSRSDQRGVGLFSAYALTGAAFGALLALTAHGLRNDRPNPAHRVLMAGAILAGGFTVAPWLKYPPNPPAVGDPGTLAQRQGLYVTVICVGIAVGILATIVSRHLRRRGWPDHRRLAVVVGTVVVPMLVAFATLPAAPDDIPVPAALVWRFRLASLGANLTLWAVLTIGLAWLVGEAVARRSAANGPHAEPAAAGVSDDPVPSPS